MNIFIAGGGRVGFHLARILSSENHDVTVIERDPTRVEHVDNSLDVSTVTGNASSVMLLRDLGVGNADLFVSAAGSDEVNLVAAATAKGLGAKRVVARVDRPVYVESNILYESILGLDYLLSPNALTAVEIAKYIDNPGIVAMEDFGRGLIQMRQVRVAKTPGQGRKKTLKNICPPGTGVLVGVVSRNGDITIPHGDATIEQGDLITLIGHRERMAPVLQRFQGTDPKPRNVFIMGAGSIGLHLAQTLENRLRSVTLLEINLKRCNDAAALLKRTNVVCQDGTSRLALEEEQIAKADVFVSTTNDDERNIMASVLAKELGAGQTVAVVHQPDFAPLVAKLGIDHAVTPRACIANRILTMVHQERVSSLAVLEEGSVEILEFAVRGAAPVIGKRLKDIQPKFPQGALVAAILRGDTVLVPGGDDEILAGDDVVVIAAADSLDAVQKLF